MSLNINTGMDKNIKSLFCVITIMSKSMPMAYDTMYELYETHILIVWPFYIRLQWVLPRWPDVVILMHLETMVFNQDN